MDEVITTIFWMLVAVVLCMVTTVTLIYIAAKLSELEDKTPTTTTKYYKGVKVQYYWSNSKGQPIIETGTIDKVQKDSVIVIHNKKFHRIVPKHKIYEPVSENV